jgi:hypothetical protein
MIGGMPIERVKPAPFGARPASMLRVLSVICAGLMIAMVASLMPISRALACSCAMRSENQAFESAEVVFVGVAVGSNAPPFLSSSVDPIEFTFTVDQQLKGEQLPQLVTVVTAASGASCGAGFQVGERWRVFARSDGPSLTSGLCDGNRLLDESAPMSPVTEDGGRMSSAPMAGIFGLGALGILVLVALFLFGVRGSA